MKYYGVYTRKFDTTDGVEYRRCFYADNQLLLRFLHNWYYHKSDWLGNDRGYAFRAFFGTAELDANEMPMWVCPERIVCDTIDTARCLLEYLKPLVGATVGGDVISYIGMDSKYINVIEIVYRKLYS